MDQGKVIGLFAEQALKTTIPVDRNVMHSS
ncbi:hypothetical protein SAMN06269250_4274 [Spirosoma fluviale]|uniref:Uncharacterized protein n=1 Tax=Spirosoma fluviale TaxID=1597977 RepID=A0A286GBP7_9BACT|nr:hypothetical protein SAMN06269250_4274 [Spirosoma fluviale]